VPITISSARPIKAIPEIEPDDKGVSMAEADHPILVMTGLGPDNSLLGTDIRLSIGGKGAPPLALSSMANIYVPSTRQFFYMAQYWKLEEATNTLVVPAAKVAQMLADIPSGEFELDIGLSSEDASFGAAWSMRGHKPTATIALQFVGFDRQPSTLAKGKTVGIVGKDTGARFTAVVDANGRITTPLLGAGMYQITVLDVNAPGFWTMAVPVYPKSTQVQASFVYQPPQPAAPGASAPAGANKPQAIRGSAGAITQDGPSPISRKVEAGGTGVKPNLLKANQWIAANRQMLMSVAADAKKLHAGPEWMDLALRKGEFTNEVKNPTVTPEGVVGAALGPWANMPSKLTFIAPHSHHWHITLQTGS
jgi:hypothetical protein